jgi:hypothetical protein
VKRLTTGPVEVEVLADAFTAEIEALPAPAPT